MTFAKLAKVSLLRRLLLPALRRLQFDFCMKHPWVPGAKIVLNSFVHKGYWFHGKRREWQSMQLVSEIISPGDTIIEVGGHIGFLSVFFASLTGKRGRVIVFEPGSNNLPYIRRNLENAGSLQGLAIVDLVEKAAGREVGELVFYEDDLSGQNNSLVRDYEGLKGNSREAYVAHKVNERVVQVTSLDAALASETIGFVKIDVEGFELGVLEGMRAILSHQRPALMVEVQADRAPIFELLSEHGYRLFNICRQSVNRPEEMFENVFALHPTTHASLIAQVMGIRTN